MPIKDKNNLIIKSGVIFWPFKDWTLDEINNLMIKSVESEGLVYINLSRSISPSFVLKFQNPSIIYSQPNSKEKLISFLYGFLPRKSDDNSKEKGFLAYKRALNGSVWEIPFTLIITLIPRSLDERTYFECHIEIQPVIYQKVHQNFVNLDVITEESFMLHMLSHNTKIIERFSAQIMGKIIEKPHYDGIQYKQQIFISHSQKDESLKDFINQPFASSNVKAIYEEYEKLLEGEITKEKIISDIDESIAIFVLLSENVNNLTNTRDWVAFESGYGAALKKDVWVLEPMGVRDKFSFVTPGLTDYLPFHLNDEIFLKYFAETLKLYDYIYIPKQNPMGIPFKCEKCQSNYKIHCPENYSFPKNFLKCPVCNHNIETEITPPSKK